MILEDIPESVSKDILDRFPQAEILDSKVRIQISKLSDVKEIIVYLTEKNIERSLQVTSPSLENAFLDLTGSHLTEEGELA